MRQVREAGGRRRGERGARGVVGRAAHRAAGARARPAVHRRARLRGARGRAVSERGRGGGGSCAPLSAAVS